MAEPTIIVHGGAGVLQPGAVTLERRDAIVRALKECVRVGQRILLSGGSSLDAVTASVSKLEDDQLFNAGRGAVFTAAGTIEMDAAIMEGRTSRLGAVAGIVGPKNPVIAARTVMERSPHLLLAGEGALRFLISQGVEFQPTEYFTTEHRRAALVRVLERGAAVTDDERHGTVGAVALDAAGNLAAATSTGGMTGKLPGRLGDTPIPGAGTWADRTVAVSCTGHGESFMRVAAGHELSARLRLTRQTIEIASTEILTAIAALGGDGGMIAIDRFGNVVMPFTGTGMYRALAVGNDQPRASIFREDLG